MLLVSKLKDIVEGYFMPKRTRLENNSISWKNISPCIHIGKKCESCPTLNINSDSMIRSNRERYLGDILTSKCKIDDNVLDRQSKGFGYCNEILVILKEVTFGRHYFDIA